MTTQYIVIYREHNQLHCDTKFIGPFADYGAAYDHLCTMPALGVNTTDGENGVKYVQELLVVPGKTLPLEAA